MTRSTSTVTARLGAALFAIATAPALAAPVLRDDFSSRASGWPHMTATRATDLGFAVYTDTGRYQLTPVHDGVFGFMPAPRQAETGNVRIEADLFLYAGIGAGAAGVGCRYRDRDNFYAFIARGDAQLMIVKVKDGKPTALAQGRVKSLVPGSVDTRFTVECRDDTLTLSARDGSTLTARDADLGSGSSGVLVVGEKLAGTSVMFDEFALTELAD